MAQVKVSDLPAASGLSTSDPVIVNQSGVTKRTTAGAFTDTMTGFLQSGTSAVAESVQSRGRWVVLLTDYMSAADRTSLRAGSTVNCDTAFTNAKARITDDGVILIPASSGTFQFTTAWTLGSASSAARVVGIGKPTVQFSTIGASTDCVTLTGASYRQVELRNLIIDCNNTGRDGLVLTSSDRPIIDNVEVKQTVRDGFVLACGTGPEWIENGEFDIVLSDIGRHGVRMQLSGTDGAFINEILWKQLEIRGIAQVTAGGRAIYLTSTATDGASKFSNHNFLKTNFDAQYAGGGAPVPDVDIIEIDSGNAEAFVFMGTHGWENTGSGSIGSGYAITQSGTGTFTKPIVGPLVLSGWGLQGMNTSVITPWYFDYRNGATYLVGNVIPTGIADLSGASSGQIAFPATQNASAGANTLDDYEEGTFTPTATIGASSTGITYATQYGHYTKIGNTVTAHIGLALSSKNALTGDVLILGLPFTAVSSGLKESIPSVIAYNLATSVLSTPMYVNGTQLEIFKITAATTNMIGSRLGGADISDTFTVHIDITYRVA